METEELVTETLRDLLSKDHPAEIRLEAARIMLSTMTATSTGKAVPSRAGEPWTDDEEQKLLNLYNSGETTTQIAEKLGRTRGAISSRLARLGILEKS